MPIIISQSKPNLFTESTRHSVPEAHPAALPDPLAALVPVDLLLLLLKLLVLFPVQTQSTSSDDS